MQGVIYEIDNSRVAKIWFAGSAAVMRRTNTFYAALAAKPFTFATPRIEQVQQVDGHTVTIEQHLAGTNLAEALENGRITAVNARTLFVNVLAELASSGPVHEGRALSVLDEDHALYDGVSDFPAALAGLADRGHSRFHDVLDASVADLDRKAAALPMRLHAVDSGRRSVVHGDMIPANILVDSENRPTAVLDWGFFTSEGDPVFDGAVAASIFDMYSSSALDTELGLYAQLEERLGYEHTAMLVYRAAYSLITANAYAPDGDDGHFRWCAAALNRPDVVQALLG
jgi:hypothetical protein